MYKWVIAGTGFLVLGVAWGTAQTGFGAFVPILTADPLDGGMGWSRTAVSTAFSIKRNDHFYRRCLLGMVVGPMECAGCDSDHRIAHGRGIFLRRQLQRPMAAVSLLRLDRGRRPGRYGGPSDSHGAALVPTKSRDDHRHHVCRVLARRLPSYRSWRSA